MIKKLELEVIRLPELKSQLEIIKIFIKTKRFPDSIACLPKSKLIKFIENKEYLDAFFNDQKQFYLDYTT